MSTSRSKSNERIDSSTMPSSPGNASISQTPKDVLPGEAAARDITKRNINSDNADERQEALLDNAGELSFPASDPISVSSISKVIRKTDAEKNR